MRDGFALAGHRVELRGDLLVVGDRLRLVAPGACELLVGGFGSLADFGDGVTLGFKLPLYGGERAASFVERRL